MQVDNVLTSAWLPLACVNTVTGTLASNCVSSYYVQVGAFKYCFTYCLFTN